MAETLTSPALTEKQRLGFSELSGKKGRAAFEYIAHRLRTKPNFGPNPTAEAGFRSRVAVKAHKIFDGTKKPPAATLPPEEYEPAKTLGAEIGRMVSDRAKGLNSGTPRANTTESRNGNKTGESDFPFGDAMKVADIIVNLMHPAPKPPPKPPKEDTPWWARNY